MGLEWSWLVSVDLVWYRMVSEDLKWFRIGVILGETRSKSDFKLKNLF